MTDILYPSFWTTLLAGDLAGAPDLRAKVLMVGTTCGTEPTAEFLTDFTTIGEFDGVGYAELDCADVDVSYDAVDGKVYIDFTDGYWEWVAAGSDVTAGLLLYLYVDPDDSLNPCLGFTDQGNFGANANGGEMELVLPEKGLMFMQQAA